MATATDACPGCGRYFAPKGLLNHLQLSHDPRCASARDHLRPAYPRILNEEPPHPPPTTDIEMIDLSDMEATPSERSSHADTANTDVSTPHHGDNNAHDRNPQPTPEEAPDHIAHPSNFQPSVVFDSDAEDSDNDGDQDWASRLGPETLPGHGSTMETDTEQTPHTGKFNSTGLVLVSNESLLARQNHLPQALSSLGPIRFAVKFVGAGEVLKTQSTPVGYRQYASGLGTEENGLTEWAPFSTRREWEVARWAKLRGPSSTALSELLAIDGVSRFTLICSSGTKLFSSFQKHLDCHFRAQRSFTRSSTRNSQVDFHNLFERRLNSQARNTSFITATYSNVSRPSTATQSLQNVWFMHPKNTIQARTKSPESSLR